MTFCEQVGGFWVLLAEEDVEHIVVYPVIFSAVAGRVDAK
jgi:hypothetical protein